MKIEAKKLQVDDKITFILGNKMLDGQIIEKNDMSKGDIDFVIKLTDGNICRVKHRNLDIYFLYGG